jgi:hypothetical protein
LTPVIKLDLLFDPHLQLKFIEDEYHHLLTFKDIRDDDGKVVKKGMDDVKAIFSLFAMAIFANVFDKRTYLPFNHTFSEPSPEELERQKKADINAIPPLERRHYCYTRGLAFDLIFWFLNHFGFHMPMEETDDGYKCLLSPFTAELGRHIITYKSQAENATRPSYCGAVEFQKQVEMALFSFPGMEEAYDNMDDLEELPLSFAFDFQDYDVTVFQSPQLFHPHIESLFEAGKNMADRKYFAAVEGQFCSSHSSRLINICCI